MKVRLFAVLAAGLIAAPSLAQDAAPLPAATASDLAALTAKAAATIKPGQPLVALPILGFGPYRAVLEYRVASAPPAIHKTQAEIFHVVSGSGTMITGGTLDGSRDVDTANQSGTAISGGVSRKLGVGDMVVVPAGVAHWIPGVDGKLVLISTKVPMN